MRAMLCFACFFLIVNSYSQYYFNDIISTRTANERYQLLRSQKIKKIKAISYDSDNSLSEGFLLEEEMSLDGKRITLNTLLSGGKASATYRIYDQGKLKKTQTNQHQIETKTDYTYDDKGLLKKILITTTDTVEKSISTEAHEWVYRLTGQPASMLRIKNNTDTTFIELVTDESGLPVEERWKKKNKTLENYYYYYDSSQQLTDIVRYHSRLKKLMPDFLYEYDNKGRILQMTQFAYNRNGYSIWKYAYNAKGLKEQETAYDKDRKLIGRMEYRYQ